MMTVMIARQNGSVTSIQNFALLLILPPDSNVESSNIASLESGCWFPLFRHRGNLECSRSIPPITISVLNLYQNKHTGCKTLPQNQCNFIPTSCVAKKSICRLHMPNERDEQPEALPPYRS